MKKRSDLLSGRRASILQVLRHAGRALHLRDIVKRTELDYDNARSALSEMTTARVLVRVSRGVYDLPERAEAVRDGASSRDILNALLKITITNNALMEALLAGQREILRAIQGQEADEEIINNLEKVLAGRVEAHFEAAARSIVAHYGKLPADVLEVLVEPLARPARAKS